MIIANETNNTGNLSMTHCKSVTSLKIILLITSISLLSGCFATKIVTVPMRVGGAVISAVPVVGDLADDTIDVAADGVDLIPI